MAALSRGEDLVTTPRLQSPFFPAHVPQSSAQVLTVEDSGPSSPSPSITGGLPNLTASLNSPPHDVPLWQSELESRWCSYVEDYKHICLALGRGEPNNLVVHRQVDGVANPEMVHRAACGITFQKGKVASILPAVPAMDQELVPEPYLLQVSRTARKFLLPMLVMGRSNVLDNCHRLL